MSFPLYVLTSSAIAAVTMLAVLSLSGRRWFAVLAAFAGATALLLVHGPLYFDFYADDAYITLRYSQHLADGLGPNWNSEGRVEGYTTFLWMGTLAGLGKLGVDLVDASRALGFLSLLATFAAVYGIWRLWGGEQPPAENNGLRSPALLAATLLGLALTDGIAFWGFSGMETPLFMALLTWSAYLYMAERRGALREQRDERLMVLPWSALVLAATAMTLMPAATPERTPMTESSSTKHSPGATSSLEAARRYISGSGFGFLTSSRLTITSRCCSMSSARSTWRASLRCDIVASPVLQKVSLATRNRLTVCGHSLSRTTCGSATIAS